MGSNDISRWLRAGAIGVTALALAAAALDVRQEGGGSVTPASSGFALNPLAVELERCSALTSTSARNGACERVWAENRRRFLGATSHAPAAPASIGVEP